MDFWIALSAVASIISSFVVAVSVIVLVRQLQESKKSKHAETFFAASVRLQEENLREKRGQVFKLMGKTLNEWTPDEIKAAEVVSHNYDIVGLMVRYEMLPKEIIIDSWGDSLRRLWPIISPLVLKYRKERDAPEFWDDFEWLSKEAILYADRKMETRK